MAAIICKNGSSFHLKREKEKKNNKKKHTLILLFGIIILIVLLFGIVNVCVCSIERLVWNDLERFHRSPCRSKCINFVFQPQETIFIGYYLQPNVIKLLSHWWDHTFRRNFIFSDDFRDFRKCKTTKILEEIFTTFFPYFYS